MYRIAAKAAFAPRVTAGALAARSPALRTTALHTSRAARAQPAHENPGQHHSGQQGGQSSREAGSKSTGLFLSLGLLAVGGGIAWVYLGQNGVPERKEERFALPPPADPQKVYDAIAKLLESNPDYDDGSYGPVFVRLAWHSAGSYDKATNTGGSNGATMRFAAEANLGANAGLKVARDLLEPIKKQFPNVSYADIYTLAGVVAIQELGGPQVPWRPGRTDATDQGLASPDGRLPDASKDAQHLRDIFYRMGFNDQEIVALSGAHALGRCHTNRSGYDGPWTFSPITVSNDYFKLLLSESWQPRPWSGPKQYEDKKTKSLMMLPTDMELVKDATFKKWVRIYAEDQDRWFQDFAKAFAKLLELGVPFPADSKPLHLRPTE